jgi:hypothetical protein
MAYVLSGAGKSAIAQFWLLPTKGLPVPKTMEMRTSLSYLILWKKSLALSSKTTTAGIADAVNMRLLPR